MNYHKSFFRVMLSAFLCLTIVPCVSLAAELKNQIILSNVKIAAISSSNCEVEISLEAAYKNFKTGKEPSLIWQIIGQNKYSSIGFKPMKEIKQNQERIKINKEKIRLAPTASCSGSCRVFLSIKDSGVRSNEIETIILFK